MLFDLTAYANVLTETRRCLQTTCLHTYTQVYLHAEAHQRNAEVTTKPHRRSQRAKAHFKPAHLVAHAETPQEV